MKSSTRRRETRAKLRLRLGRCEKEERRKDEHVAVQSEKSILLSISVTARQCLVCSSCVGYRTFVRVDAGDAHGVSDHCVERAVTYCDD